MSETTVSILTVVGVLAVGLTMAAGNIWLERRLLARQRRLRSAPSPEALQAAEDALASQLAGAARILHL